MHHFPISREVLTPNWYVGRRRPPFPNATFPTVWIVLTSRNYVQWYKSVVSAAKPAEFGKFFSTILTELNPAWPISLVWDHHLGITHAKTFQIKSLQPFWYEFRSVFFTFKIAFSGKYSAARTLHICPKWISNMSIELCINFHGKLANKR